MQIRAGGCLGSGWGRGGREPLRVRCGSRLVTPRHGCRFVARLDWGVLLAVWQQAEESGTVLAVACAPESLRLILQISGVDRLLRNFDGVADAEAVLAAEPPGGDGATARPMLDSAVEGLLSVQGCGHLPACDEQCRVQLAGAGDDTQGVTGVFERLVVTGAMCRQALADATTLCDRRPRRPGWPARPAAASTLAPPHQRRSDQTGLWREPFPGSPSVPRGHLRDRGLPT